MEWVEIKGSSRAEAEAKALEVFETDDIDSLDIEELKTTRKFMGMGGTVVKLRARRKEVVAKEAEPLQKTEEEKEEAEQAAEETVEKAPVADSYEAVEDDIVTQESKYRPWIAEGPEGIVIPRKGKGYGDKRLYSSEPPEERGGNRAAAAATTKPVAEAFAAEEEEEEFTPEVYADAEDSPIEEGSREMAVAFVKRTLEDMGIEGGVQGFKLHDRLLIQISSESSGLLIGRKGETLEALQYLVDIIINRTLEHRIRIVLDADYYRERKKSKVVSSAKKAADNAVRTRKSVALAPMNPADRRLVHVTLAKDERVETESEGEGSRRRVVIYLKGANRKKPFKKKGPGKQWRR